MSDILRYVLGFLMLNWPLVIAAVVLVRWTFKGGDHQ